MSVLLVGKNHKILVDGVLLDNDFQETLSVIQSEGLVSKINAEKLCAVMQPLHQVIRSGMANDKLFDDPIFLAPSVNLYPIPFEIILGSYCEGVASKIVLVNDFARAVDASQNLINMPLPKELIAVGNPTFPVESGFDSLLAEVESEFRGINRKISTNSLETLAPLPDAELEVSAIKSHFSESSLLLGKHGSIRSALAKTQNSTQAVLVLATHGLPVDLTLDSAVPSLLSVEDDELTVVSSMEVLGYDLSDTVVMLSACDTAAGFIDDYTQMFTGFVKSFANAGSEVIVASLWPVKSVASRLYSEALFLNWSRDDRPVDASANVKHELGEDGFPFVMVYP